MIRITWIILREGSFIPIFYQEKLVNETLITGLDSVFIQICENMFVGVVSHSRLNSIYTYGAMEIVVFMFL